jgi:hypothetical protein
MQNPHTIAHKTSNKCVNMSITHPSGESVWSVTLNGRVGDINNTGNTKLFWLTGEENSASGKPFTAM